MAVAGGREGWGRIVLIGIGVGLGVALLLVAAAVPTAWQERHQRSSQIDVEWSAQEPAAEDTLRVELRMMPFRSEHIRGVIVAPDGPHAPVPPGLQSLPGPGELVASPALARLLGSPDGKLLRPRLDHPIVGSIGDDGLRHPHEFSYYLGADEQHGMRPDDDVDGARISQFGKVRDDRPVDPVLAMLVAVGVVVLLLPVAMFVAVAVRFAGERRDRRLAAVRLAGADTGMVRRIAAGEALVAAGGGLVVGALLFLAGRPFVEYVRLFDVSVFAADLRPSAPLLALIIVGIPVLAVAVTVVSMRRLIVEPLGVVRQARPVRRRLWWRLLPPAAGLVLLLPLLGHDLSGNELHQITAGVVLILLGVATLLPWLTDVLVRRQRGHGPLSWQLAVRRLQHSGGSVGRIVNGTAVALTGAIALQMLFFSAEADVVPSSIEAAPVDPDLAFTRMAAELVSADAARQRYAATEGVHEVAVLEIYFAHTDDHWGADVGVADCASLRQLLQLADCADGDAFLLEPAEIDPGTRLTLHDTPQGTHEWVVPASARRVSPSPGLPHYRVPAVLVTPAAAPPGPHLLLDVYLRQDPAVADAIEHMRNTTHAIAPRHSVWTLASAPENEDFEMIRRGLLVGVTVTLGLIGLSLLVGTVDQLRERRRLLAALAAFGVTRSTMAWSVLWQTAVPVLLGVVVAAMAGLGLGALLVALANINAIIDLGQIATFAAVAVAVVLVVTLLSMPTLRRLMRIDGLRTE